MFARCIQRTKPPKRRHRTSTVKTRNQAGGLLPPFFSTLHSLKIPSRLL